MYIYIHIPFCTNICSYCDFPKLLYDKKYTRKYLEMLASEIDSRYSNEEVVSIYIGGGTPTSLDLSELEYLLRLTTKFKKNNNIEFTIESNIESLDEDKIKLLKDYGVNRISLGVQSFNDKTLEELNRRHRKNDIKRVVKLLKNNNFYNISVDYIYGVHDDLEEVKEDIEEYLELDIPHISCYSLIIENNTVFGIKKRNYIDETHEEEMYRYIEYALTSNGYGHYEISNYGKDGYKSLHNLNYWNNGYYYGFGMGAVSYLDNKRIINTLNLSKYLDGEFINNIEAETRETEISNTFMLGFRKIDGINVGEFEKRFGFSPLDMDIVKRLIDEEKLILDGDQLFINQKYIYLSNSIIMEFI